MSMMSVNMLIDMERGGRYSTCWLVAMGIRANFSSGVNIRVSMAVTVAVSVIHMSHKMGVNVRSNVDIGVPRGCHMKVGYWRVNMGMHWSCMKMTGINRSTVDVSVSELTILTTERGEWRSCCHGGRGGNV